MKRCVTVVGARPQFIKAAVVSRLLRKEFEEVIIHTGQHFDYNMSRVFFDELGIPKPNYNLGISGGTHAEMTGKMLIEIEGILKKTAPDFLLLYGDTNSTLAGALAAVKLQIPIVHVEAGNRCGTLSNPEEINRICTDHISSVLFSVSDIEKENLCNEGIKKNVYVVGNTMYDAYKYFGKKNFNINNILDFEGKAIGIPARFYYMTCHRQENTYNSGPLTEILSAMNALEYPTIYPVHPRNQFAAKEIVKKNKFGNIILAQPVGYKESIWLINHCEKVVTDSGGLQTEAFFAGKQCVTIFDYVTWPQTMVGNRNQICKPNRDEILSKLRKDQIIDMSYKPFGDGNAAEKIVGILTKEPSIFR